MTEFRMNAFGRLVAGCAALGGLYEECTPENAQQTLAAAWEQGIRAFDTAPHYGRGLSEERVGKFLSQQPRDQFALSTKVGRLLVDDPDAPADDDVFFGTPRRRRVLDYTGDGVRRSIEQSLERMGLDRIDLVLVHDPEDHLDTAIGSAAPALRQLRDEGVIGGFGVGTNYAETAERFATETDVDHVLIAGRHSLLDRRAERVLALCGERGVHVLVAAVLNSGILANPDATARFNYMQAPDELISTAQQMAEACARYGVPLRAAAFQFPFRNPSVDAVVIGSSTPEMIIDTVQQFKIEISEELWRELEWLVPAQETLPTTGK
ncbi:aldo/keto reductase [Microlunatus panaciterrae]|uniref:D-threo-aldose 1-dehydrogenase n=1 Tax=Microlunatus panaciterrae TaxID=400768 RepID=A0ABS2REX3_9ACTN|nr:aldo/keto reductase [Microlunatus panaciterrae]MBM7797544.1 D-threo-aldose 1-dehydrogenase [Microlunatus panaciterrae]